MPLLCGRGGGGGVGHACDRASRKIPLSIKGRLRSGGNNKPFHRPKNQNVDRTESNY